MRTLILLDLDNVLRTQQENDQKKLPSEWRLPDAGKTGMTRYVPVKTVGERPTGFVQEGQHELPDNGAIVVIAFNQSTAGARNGVPLTTAYLRRLTETTAKLLRVTGEVRCEVIPVLTVPQAADVALLQALQRAPTDATLGPFERLVVVSGDRGLVDAAGGIFQGERDERGMRRGNDVHTFPRALFHRRNAGYRRLAPPPATQPALPPQPLSGWSARVTSEQHLAALNGAKIDWNSIGDFTQLGKYITKEPGRVEALTQLGPTRTSQRGVARLGACLNTGHASLLPAGKDDGIEVEGTGVARGSVTRVSQAFLDEGVVRIDDFNATLPSRLPSTVVAEAAKQYRFSLSSTESLISDVMGCWRAPTALASSANAEVVFQKFQRSLRCEVRLSQGHMPAAWWFFDRRATSRLACELPQGFFIPKQLEVNGVPFVGRIIGNVDIAAPREGVVMVESCAAGWQIVSGRQGDESVMVLLSDRHAEAAYGSRKFHTRRIQEIQKDGPPPGFPSFPDTTFWYFLRRLPILMACQPVP